MYLLHKMNRTLLLFIFLILNTSSLIFAQNAKKYFSSGEKFLKANNYVEAISNFSKCIELEPNFTKAYLLRAACYEQSGKKSEAAEDYKRASAFSTKDKEIFYNAGRLFMEINNPAVADEMLKKRLSWTMNTLKQFY